MRKIVFLGVVTLVVMSVLFVGCSSPAPAPAPANPAPAPAPGAPAAGQTVTGEVTVVNTPEQTGPDVITIKTAYGTQTFGVTPDTVFSLEGQACNLIDLGTTVLQSGTTYNCTGIYDAAYNLLELSVWKAEP